MNFSQKIQKISDFEKLGFWELNILNFFASSPWKSVTNYVLEWVGLIFFMALCSHSGWVGGTKKVQKCVDVMYGWYLSWRHFLFCSAVRLNFDVWSINHLSVTLHSLRIVHKLHRQELKKFPKHFMWISHSITAILKEHSCGQESWNYFI